MPERLEPKEKLAAARDLRKLVEDHREVIDRERKLPEPILDALGQLGVFRALIPAAAGGGEWDHPTWLRVIEQLSRLDGAVGWNSGVGASATGFLTGWVSEDVARRISSAGANGVVAGAGAPSGKARRVTDGYVLSGRWQFASGISHARWIVAGFVLEGEAPRIGRGAWLPVEDAEVIDTWFVGGMRGTASLDFAVKDLRIASEFVFDFVEQAPVHPGPLYRLPAPYALASGLAPLSLGIARGAIDTFTELIESKTDRFSGARMRDRMTVQERLAQAEALVRAARALLYETIEELWEVVCRGDVLDARQVALGQLALTHAVDSGAKAVDLVYHASGTSAIFTSNPLERYFRDIHVATQHRFASPQELYKVGAVLLEAH